MIFKRQILFFISFYFVQIVIAQEGFTIKASVDKNRILIGQPLLLTVEVYFTSQAIFRDVPVDTIAHFELLEKPVIDTISKKNGLTIRGVYKLTSFDSGHWVIPSFSLSQDVKTDTIPIDVIFSDFDPNQEYHDIKDILEVKPSKRKMEWWWYALGGVLVLGLIWLYLRRKKIPQPVFAPKVMVSPYEEAMKQLEQLQRDKPEAKQYYSKLTDIFRLYIFRKKGILSLQKTTDDLVVQLKELNFSKEQFDKLSQTLRLSDFVKFAKYIPTREDDGNSFNEIRNAIMSIEKTEAKAPL